MYIHLDQDYLEEIITNNENLQKVTYLIKINYLYKRAKFYIEQFC